MTCGFEFYEMLQPRNMETFPEKTKFFTIPVSNFGSPNKKRMRVWPFVLDTLGEDVTFTPIVDGTAGATSTFNGNKKTYFHHFTTDVFGVDYSGTLSCAEPFELWEIQKPEIVQILPIAKRFDQLGPKELFRLGKINKFQLRLIAFGGTSIPYRIYFEDDSVFTENLTVEDGEDGVYEIGMPKSINGTLLRLELGPTDFDFHRYYGRIQCASAGRDTENEWINLVSETENAG